MNIGEVFLLRRRQLGLTKAEVAKIAGCSRNKIAKIERGYIGGLLSEYIKIAEALHLQLIITIYPSTEEHEAGKESTVRIAYNRFG